MQLASVSSLPARCSSSGSGKGRSFSGPHRGCQCQIPDWGSLEEQARVRKAWSKRRKHTTALPTTLPPRGAYIGFRGLGCLGLQLISKASLGSWRPAHGSSRLMAFTHQPLATQRRATAAPCPGRGNPPASPGDTSGLPLRGAPRHGSGSGLISPASEKATARGFPRHLSGTPPCHQMPSTGCSYCPKARDRRAGSRRRRSGAASPPVPVTGSAGACPTAPGMGGACGFRPQAEGTTSPSPPLRH